jgi:hypothetical protein
MFHVLVGPRTVLTLNKVLSPGTCAYGHVSSEMHSVEYWTVVIITEMAISLLAECGYPLAPFMRVEECLLVINHTISVRCNFLITDRRCPGSSCGCFLGEVCPLVYFVSPLTHSIQTSSRWVLSVVGGAWVVLSGTVLVLFALASRGSTQGMLIQISLHNSNTQFSECSITWSGYLDMSGESKTQ